MKRSHLPLTALRTFEVAARHQSFADAAEELAITQPAISKQIAALEDRLGVELYERAHRSVKLTWYGRRLADRLTGTFDRMATAIDALTAEKEPERPLTVTVESDFARLWLLPKIADYERARPGRSVSIHAEIDPKDFDDTTSDCAIVWGDGWWENRDSEPLFTNSAFPVCVPALARELRENPDRLAQVRLIHDRTTDWWRRAALVLGRNDFDWSAGPVYNQTGLCLEAALQGEAVTIGDEVSSRFYIERGELAIPFDIHLPSPTSYYFLRGREVTTDPDVEHFRNWLTDKAVEHRRWLADYWSGATAMSLRSGA